MSKPGLLFKTFMFCHLSNTSRDNFDFFPLVKHILSFNSASIKIRKAKTLNGSQYNGYEGVIAHFDISKLLRVTLNGILIPLSCYFFLEIRSSFLTKSNDAGRFRVDESMVLLRLVSFKESISISCFL